MAAIWGLAGEKGIFKTGVSASAKCIVVCGDCGHFMLFATVDELQEMRSKWDQLTPATK
ncbi:MAG: hypothetical protein HYY06_01800 [Deltaproteobacteria bacterium]|nr:hypothetical protein [Deltaproteobacteria bacterium]